MIRLHVSEAQGSRLSCSMEHGFCKVCPPHFLINWLHPFPLFIKVHWYRKKDTHLALFFLYGPLNNSQWDSCNFRRDTCFRRWSQSHLFVSILAFNETPTPRKSFTLSPSICSCPFLPVWTFHLVLGLASSFSIRSMFPPFSSSLQFMFLHLTPLILTTLPPCPLGLNAYVYLCLG